MTTADLSPAQRAALNRQAVRMLRYLTRLTARMDRTGWDPNDPVRVAAWAAWEKVQAFRVRVHYASDPTGQAGA